MPGDLRSEYRSFEEVPGKVHADRKPQIFGNDERRPKEDSGFKRDRYRRDPRRTGIERMRRAEDERGYRERDPGSHPFFDQAEEHTAEKQLFECGTRRKQ